MSTNTAKLKAAARAAIRQPENTIAQTRDLKTMLASPAVTGRINEVLGKKAAAFSASLLQVCRSNALLQQAEPMSVIAAAMTAATLDLPLNQSLGFAYIVPHNTHDEYKHRGYVEYVLRMLTTPA